MKVYIKAMSMKRADLRDYIESHTRQVFIALTQLYLFPSGNRVHWRKEVWDKFSEMHTMKPTNKLPSAKFILDNSFEIYKNKIPDIIERVIDKEEMYTPIGNIDDYALRILIQDYFTWLSNYFSQKEMLSKSDVLDELDKLGLTIDYYEG